VTLRLVQVVGMGPLSQALGSSQAGSQMTHFTTSTFKQLASPRL
jgi:hypothetical protein